MFRFFGLFLATVLGGCALSPDISPETPAPTAPAPSQSAHVPWEVPSLHPIDVVGDATRVITTYLAVTDEIGAGGGVDVERMRPVVTSNWFSREEAGFEEYRTRSIRTIGRTRFDHFEVQSARIGSEGQIEVAVVLCVDSSKVLVASEDMPQPPESLVLWLDSEGSEAETDAETLEQWQEFTETSGARFGFREPITVWLVGDTLSSLRVDSTENWLGAHPCEEQP